MTPVSALLDVRRSRPKRKARVMGVYARGKKLWIRFRDVSGKCRDASTGYEVGQEALAQAMKSWRASPRPIRTDSEACAGSAIAVRAFVADKIAKRRERGLDWKNAESRLKHHVLPELGDLPLVEVRARHVVDLQLPRNDRPPGSVRHRPDVATSHAPCQPYDPQ